MVLPETTVLINVYNVLKEIIDAYRILNGSVFTCFLDASKSFDRVNHFSLFAKLSNWGIPQYVIRILSYWYENQQMCVHWGGTYSSFSVLLIGFVKAAFCRHTCLIYKYYVDDLGCCVGNVIINHLMYADDWVILVPYVAGLSKLLS